MRNLLTTIRVINSFLLSEAFPEKLLQTSYLSSSAKKLVNNKLVFPVAWTANSFHEKGSDYYMKETYWSYMESSKDEAICA